MTKTAEFSPRPRLVDEFLVADGITRAGKFMLGNVVSAIERVDFLQHAHLLETIPYLHHLGKLETDAAKALLRTEIDFCVYDRMIGRGLNGRVHDLSCIMRAPDPDRYLARASAEDDSELMKRFTHERRLPLFVAHEILCHAAFFFDVFPKARMLQILRDPAALVHSWHKRGWGKRFGTDPKSMDHAFKGASGPIPWFATRWEKDYHALGEMDRIVLSIATLFDLMKRQYQALPANTKKRILFLGFEELCADPAPIVRRLTDFISSPSTPAMEAVLRRERLPRGVPADARKALMSSLTPELSGEGRQRLEMLVSDYDHYWLPLTAVARSAS